MKYIKDIIISTKEPPVNNVAWLTKDKLHFSDFGGRRVAIEIIAKAF